MSLFSTKDVAEAAELGVRQVQNYIERNVVHAQQRQNGRGHSFMFDNDDLIRFLTIKEMMKFGLGNEQMYSLISNYFIVTHKQADVKKYLKKKLYLENRHFYLVREYPTKGEHDEVSGYLIYNPDDPLPSLYFQKPDEGATPGFYGYNFEEFSRSALLIDMGAIYKKRYEFLLKHSGSTNADELEDEVKSNTKMKGQ